MRECGCHTVTLSQGVPHCDACDGCDILVRERGVGVTLSRCHGAYPIVTLVTDVTEQQKQLVISRE